MRKLMSAALVAMLGLGLTVTDVEARSKKSKSTSRQELGKIVCPTGQVVKYDGSAWACADDDDTLGSLPCTDGEIAKFVNGAWECATENTAVDGKKYVFVTSQTYNGDLKTEGGALTGLRGGDAICQAAAENGSVPPGEYVAWLSTSTKDAKDRLLPAPGGYFLPDGTTKIADNLADLIDGSIDTSINMDEFGATPQPPDFLIYTWTGTLNNGLRAPPSKTMPPAPSTNPDASCGDWTIGAPGERYGVSGTAVLNTAPPPFEPWSAPRETGAFRCATRNHLYCFQRR